MADLSGLASTVASIETHCGNTQEAVALVREFYRHLETLQTELESLERQNGLPSRDVVDSYRSIVDNAFNELVLYKDMKFLLRLVNYRKLKTMIARWMEGVVEIKRVLGIEIPAATTDFYRIEANIEQAFDFNATEIMSELHDLKSQTVAEMLLKYEIEVHGVDLPDETAGTIRSTLRRIRMSSRVEEQGV